MVAHGLTHDPTSLKGKVLKVLQAGCTGLRGRTFRSLACLAWAQMAIWAAPAVMNMSAGSVQVAAANRTQP